MEKKDKSDSLHNRIVCNLLGTIYDLIPSKVESVLNSTKPWTWIRTVGIDMPSESIVLSKGETIQPVHMALLAQVGISLEDVQVKRLPMVGVLSTGNELVASDKSSGAQ